MKPQTIRHTATPFFLASVFIFIFFPFLLLKAADPAELALSQIIATSEAVASNEQVRQRLLILEKEIEAHAPKSQKNLLRKIYRQARKHFLHNYKPYSYFSSTVLKGEYDCLTGTSLVAWFLERFGFSYQIAYTGYHTYLIVHLSDNDRVLLETTDPLHGWVDNEKAIDRRSKSYLKPPKKEDACYEFSLFENHSIKFAELPGLLYYNQAVAHFNNQDYNKAILSLEESLCFYNDSNLQMLFWLSVAHYSQQPEISTADKQYAKQKYQKYYNEWAQYKAS
ncbi:MAG: hypothetical protein JJT94_04940 [Bernardetiaceae bacterium]|nr:hypothetical protein [Bernardetiaceae bacterium]